MAKKLIDFRKQKKELIRKEVDSAQSQLQALVNSYLVLGVGDFDESVLGISSNGRPPSYNPGCRTCDRSALSFSGAQEYVLERLIDQSVGSQAVTLGQIKLNRESVKTLLQLPDKELMNNFEEKLKYFKISIARLNTDYSPYSFLEIIDGQVKILESELLTYCRSLEIYASSPEKIQLLERLETMAELLNEVNPALQKFGFKPFEIPARFESDNPFIQQQGTNGWETAINIGAVAPRLKD